MMPSVNWSDIVATLSLPRQPRVLSYDGYRHAAVAIVLTKISETEIVFPLTVRSPKLRTHSGQISLPGGTTDEGESAATCARRETEEELGIPRGAMEVVCLLDAVPTPSQFMITPVVCTLANPLSYNISEHEVAEVFEMPLSSLWDMTTREDFGTRHYRGHAYPLHAYHHAGYRIWGATARILRQLGDLLGAPSGPESQ